VAGLAPLVLLLTGAWSLLTYQPGIDGPPETVQRTWLVAAAGAAAGLVLLLFASGQALQGNGAQSTTQRRPFRLAATLALAFLLLPPGLHLARLLHPSNRGAPYWQVEEDFAGPLLSEGRWLVPSGPAARWHLRDARLVLENGPHEPVFLEAAFLLRDPRPSPWRELQPAGLPGWSYSEQLSWRSRVLPGGRFFVLLDVRLAGRELRLQLLPGGIHVTFPDARGVPQGQEIAHPAGADRREHAWRLRRAGGSVTLEVDGQASWTAADPGPLTRIRFGEVIADEWHGGRLELGQVRYERRVAAR
jgi:hypothetical protein